MSWLKKYWSWICTWNSCLECTIQTKREGIDWALQSVIQNVIMPWNLQEVADLRENPKQGSPKVWAEIHLTFWLLSRSGQSQGLLYTQVYKLRWYYINEHTVKYLGTSLFRNMMHFFFYILNACPIFTHICQQNSDVSLFLCPLCPSANFSH